MRIWDGDHAETAGSLAAHRLLTAVRSPPSARRWAHLNRRTAERLLELFNGRPGFPRIHRKKPDRSI